MVVICLIGGHFELCYFVHLAVGRSVCVRVLLYQAVYSFIYGMLCLLPVVLPARSVLWCGMITE